MEVKQAFLIAQAEEDPARALVAPIQELTYGPEFVANALVSFLASALRNFPEHLEQEIEDLVIESFLAKVETRNENMEIIPQEDVDQS